MSERAARSNLLRPALCLLLLASGAARAQTEEPPQLRRFGSSLEQLKWDAEQKRAVESADARKQGGAGGDEEDEVVRVETSLVVWRRASTPTSSRTSGGATSSASTLRTRSATASGAASP